MPGGICMSVKLGVILLNGLYHIPVLAMIISMVLFVFMQWIKRICHNYFIKNGQKGGKL